MADAPRKDGEPMRVAEVEGPPPAQASATGGPAKAGKAALTLGALGVVFGDIGTSPLYALQTRVPDRPDVVRPTQAERLRRHLARLLGRSR